MGMLRNIAEFECVMAELSAVTGLSVSACADIVRNTAKETGHSWGEVAAHLKWEAMKGSKIHGHGGSKANS
jgi:hypothetical protein